MWDILKALGFMALGGLIAHVSWLHAWRMYKNGKKEGQGMHEEAPHGTQPTRQSIAINRRSGQ